MDLSDKLTLLWTIAIFLFMNQFRRTIFAFLFIIAMNTILLSHAFGIAAANLMTFIDVYIGFTEFLLSALTDILSVTRYFTSEIIPYTCRFISSHTN